MWRGVTAEANCSECAFIAHNIVLTMQAMGLGGLYFNGLNRWSILGAFAGQGIRGFGFRFQHDTRWTLPNPVGLEGVYEGMCPPWFDDMRAAARRAFVARKFGQGGTYDPATAPVSTAMPSTCGAGTAPWTITYIDDEDDPRM